ncbi:MAG: methylase HpaI [Candidatus Berkelbacteria bacterium Athens1014_28]|uniref:Methylase HpaI n=1 Tax=Candidatus Berkelbacteria bacterium Athens1014_28 TaxID=2017145 RepID=A0A554LMB2_9BACT|nr:MAG: methylase HpaI [Candidatus Berkelbacteria bacterium Athens1014_28]
MENLENRTLFFGDNLEILRDKIPDDCIDLIYLDPPFNSNRNYNILYKEGLVDSPAQVQAFEDSWHWTREAEHIFNELVGTTVSKTKINQKISDLMQALEKLVGKNDVLAYLTMMTIRLIELRRVLKPTGSIYLHCDPTASHYLKIVMDAVFGKTNFRNEIVWCYSRPSVPGQKQLSKVHDIIFWYSKSDDWKFDPDAIRQPYSESSLAREGYGGKASKMTKGAPVELKEGGKFPEDWIRVSPLKGNSKEYLGYQTQKPEALLERIIKSSSKEGDLVLDPFCGCGTTVAVAEKLKRKWIGIDITTLAITLIKSRLEKKFPDKNLKIKIDGLPKDLAGAKELAVKNRFEFEYWALQFVSAIPAPNKSKGNMHGADKGIDGIVNFYTKLHNGKEIGKAIVQVKSGGVKRNDIATLKGDIEREKANAGIFITLEEPTRPMIEEAISAGSFSVDYTKVEFPKIQIMTIAELLKDMSPKLPAGWFISNHKEAEAEKEDHRQPFSFGEF